MWAASINQPHKWGKWKCPKCEIWVAPPRTGICEWCREKNKELVAKRDAREKAKLEAELEVSSKSKCQECGGLTYHIGDCSLMLIPRAKREAPDEFPCIVCGGEKVHGRIDGAIVCQRVLARENLPCDKCGGLRKHWADCVHFDKWNAAHPRKCDLTIAERIASAETRMGGWRMH